MMQFTNAQHPLCACVRIRGGHFEQIVTYQFVSLYLINFMLRTMSDASGDVLRVH